MYEAFLIAGFGGQGIMFAGQLLAYAAMGDGLEVTWYPSYGPEMRGGTAHCHVVISDKSIGSPIVRQPNIVMAFNNPSLEKYESHIAPGGLLAYNASLITIESNRADIARLPVPASALADEVGSLKLANVVLLGAVLTMRPILSLDVIKRTLKEHISTHHQELLPLNYKALEKGAAFAASLTSESVSKMAKSARP